MSPQVDLIKLYVDGACSGNPGPGAVGIFISDDDNQELATHKECIGHTTNNRAEYHAVIKGLELALGICRKKVICHSDSELLINQINGQWKIRNAELRKLCIKVKELELLFEEVIFQRTPRENKYVTKADKLANQALFEQ